MDNLSVLLIQDLALILKKKTLSKKVLLKPIKISTHLKDCLLSLHGFVQLLNNWSGVKEEGIGHLSASSMQI